MTLMLHTACQESSLAINQECKVVTGEMTIFTSNGNLPESQKEIIIKAIKGGMDDGDYQTADSAIVSLKYLDDLPVDNVDKQVPTKVSDDSNGAEETKVNGGISMAPILATTFASAFLIVGLYVGRQSFKKRRENDDEGDVNFDEEHSLVNGFNSNAYGQFPIPSQNEASFP